MISIDDLVYIYADQRITLSYRHRSPRPMAFFQGSSKKMCKFLIIDRSNDDVVYSIPYPTKENLEKILEDIDDNHRVHVVLPSFTSMMKHLFGNNIKLLFESSYRSARMRVRTVMPPRFKVVVDVGTSNKLPVVIKKHAKLIDNNAYMLDHKFHRYGTVEKSYVSIYGDEDYIQLYSRDDISKFMSIIKMVYSSEPRTVMLYSSGNPEHADRLHIADLLVFLNNLPLEYHNTECYNYNTN